MTHSAAKPDKMRIALLAIGGVLWAVVFAVLYFVWQQRQSTADPGDDGNDPQPFAVSTPFRPWKVTDFTLTECRGRTVRKADLLGRPWVASFIFTHCKGSCPRVVAQLASLKRLIGATDTRLVTFTVDPERDTPDVLKRYAAELKAEPDSWMFLTGSKEDLHRLIQRGFQMPVAERTGADRKPGDEFAHSPNILLVDRTGTVVGKFDGTSELEMAALTREIRKLDKTRGYVSAGSNPAAKSPITSQGSSKNPGMSTPPKKLFTGKVVMLREALKRRGITAFDEFDKQVVLETPQGELIPIIPDWRGRAFYQDKRLRDRKVDLVGFRRKGVPYLQVLMVFTYNAKGERQYTDYWCDICSIPMYEVKPCDCCQGVNRLRFQSRPLPDYLTGKTDKSESRSPRRKSKQ